MYKNGLFLIIVLLMTALFSCNNGSVEKALDASAANRKLSDVVFGVIIPDELKDPDRKLSANTSFLPDSSIAYYKYKAVPQFSLGNGIPVMGATDEWINFELGESILFAQGYWHFTIAACGSDHSVLLQGECDSYISSDSHIININMGSPMGGGAIDMEIQVAQMSQTGGHLTVRWHGVNGSNGVYSSFSESRDNANGLIFFTGTLSGLESGYYTLAFTFGDEYEGYHYGEIISVEVRDDVRCEVTGKFATGNLLVKGQTKILNGDRNHNISLLCGETGSNYVWYLDDVEVKNSAAPVYVFNTAEFGEYQVKCVVDGDTANPAQCHINIMQGITVTMHMADMVQEYHTYSGRIHLSDLPELGEIYDGYWYDAPEDGAGGGGNVIAADFNFTEDTHVYAHRNFLTVYFDGGTAKYKNKTYNVTLERTSQGVYQGAAIGSLPHATVQTNSGAGVSFSLNGWGTAPDGGLRIHESSEVHTSETYYAQWVPMVVSNRPAHAEDSGSTTTYNITFFITDSSGRNPVGITAKRVPKGSIMTMPMIPLQEGKALDGWYVSDIGGTEWDFSDEVDRSMNLYGRWIDGDYTVTFETGGGSMSVTSIGVIAGKHAAKPEKPVRDGYIFGGWFKESSCINRFDFATEIPTSDITLYAQWYQKKSYIANTDGNDAYIDVGFIPDKYTGMELKFEHAGCHGRHIAGTPAFAVGAIEELKVFGAHYGKDTERIPALGFRYDDGAHVLQLCDIYGFRVDGNLIREPIPDPVFEYNSITLFKDSSSPETTHGKLYYFKIMYTYFDEEGNPRPELYMDLYPVVRVSDGKVGLFDTVNNVFHTSMNEYDFETD